jgi:hypothetical protein
MPKSDGAKMVTGVLVGTAPSEAVAEEICDRFAPCPYASMYASSGRTVVAVLGMPESKRWWLEWAQERPEVMGLESAAALLAGSLVASSPWTRGEMAPTLETAPCGADCRACDEYQGRCSGCPVTTFLMA